MEHEELSKQIIGCAMTVHRTLGPGFLESVYQNALAHELRKSGLCVECEKKISVVYDGIVPDGHPNSPTCGHLKLPHPERGVTMG